MLFDINKDKAGRDIYGIPVFQAKLNNTFDILKDYGVKEIIFALPPSTENTAELYDYYKKSNCKIKIYDYPSFQTAGKSDSFVNLRLRICFLESRLRFQMKRLWAIMQIRSSLLRAAVQ